MGKQTDFISNKIDFLEQEKHFCKRQISFCNRQTNTYKKRLEDLILEIKVLEAKKTT